MLEPKVCKCWPFLRLIITHTPTVEVQVLKIGGHYTSQDAAVHMGEGHKWTTSPNLEDNAAA